MKVDSRTVRQARLTYVDRGTPMGEYQRRFWHPIAATIEFEKWPVKKVRLLGEDLALFWTENGTLGLVGDRCPHRGASLSCGMTDGDGIRCAYHGWLYEGAGTCVDTPTEPVTSRLKSRIKIAGYPVDVMGGLVWAYLGPQPAPLLPRFEHLIADGWNRSTGFTSIPCNWLQIAENTLDPLHVEQLHMKYTNWVRARNGEAPVKVRHHLKVDYELFDYGILKKRLWEGDSEDSDEWQVGHPLIFPGTLLFPYNADYVQYQFRVPVDNENTIVYWYHAKRPPTGEEPTTTVPVWDNPFKSPDGEFLFGNVNAQDMMRCSLPENAARAGCASRTRRGSARRHSRSGRKHALRAYADRTARRLRPERSEHAQIRVQRITVTISAALIGRLSNPYVAATSSKG
jgi:5,5'-dehydrodivanillate O-demethylase